MSKGGERNTKYGRNLLARKYNERIKILTAQKSFDGFSGETFDGYTEIGEIWADYSSASDEMMKNYGIDYNVDVAIFRVRSTTLPTPTKNSYIGFNGKVYSISSLRYIRDERREVEIVAVEYAG